MPLIVARPMNVDDSSSFVEIGQLHSKYPQHCVAGAAIRAYLNRVYNEDRKIVLQPRKSVLLKVQSPKTTYGSFRLDLSPLLDLGIAKGYTPEILAINFVVRNNEIPILPNELEVDAYDSEIRQRISEEALILRKIGESFETIGILHQTGLHDIANDLTEGLTRAEKNDYEGAIKFFRKVVEGFRLISEKQALDSSKNRSAAISEFLTKSFGLISNLGEHYGTYGSPEDAAFSRDLTVAVARYLARKVSK